MNKRDVGGGETQEVSYCEWRYVVTQITVNHDFRLHSSERVCPPGLSYGRQEQSPVESDSAEDWHHDEDTVDGLSLFVKKPSKDFKR